MVSLMIDSSLKFKQFEIMIKPPTYFLPPTFDEKELLCTHI